MAEDKLSPQNKLSPNNDDALPTKDKNEEKLPLRSEVREEDTWNLSDLFPSDEAWLRENEALKAQCPVAEAFKGRLGSSAETLLEYFMWDEELSARIRRLYCYASCKGDQDTANPYYQDLRGKAMNTAVALSAATSFARSELMELSDDTLNLFYTVQPGLLKYRRALDQLRLLRDHILTAPEEALLASAGEMADTAENVVSTLRNADLRYEPAVDSEGETHLLTSGTFVPLEQSPDRTLRENAFRNVYNRLGDFKNTIAATLDGQFKKLIFYSKARKYPDTLTAALTPHEVPVSVYTNLISAVHHNLDKMYRYVALRKQTLGVEELHMYDVYVPLVADMDEKIPYDRAKETVLQALSVLGEDYTDLLRQGFENRWIDVYENQGKRSGAYSTDCGKPHPYVLLNQKDNLESMFTIAHEMGHALHSWYSNTNQPEVYSDYVIFVAEVASTCNEILLMRHLLDKTQDPRYRTYLINHFLEEFKGTLFRQTMFAEFELEMGKMAESGQTLTADALCEKYLELNKLYFGPDMVSDPEIALEWARIPHFFYNYYVFQYATGFSAAVAIANRILAEGAPAVADYKRFLSGGCSRDPISLLKIAGVDMSGPEPVQSALNLFNDLLAEI